MDDYLRLFGSYEHIYIYAINYHLLLLSYTKGALHRFFVIPLIKTIFETSLFVNCLRHFNNLPRMNSFWNVWRWCSHFLQLLSSIKTWVTFTLVSSNSYFQHPTWKCSLNIWWRNFHILFTKESFKHKQFLFCNW
jgi:hypothetical protein